MERGDKDNGTEESDQKAFNETLKRMLKTPPKPHKDKGSEGKGSPDQSRSKPKDSKNSEPE